MSRSKKQPNSTEPKAPKTPEQNYAIVNSPLDVPQQVIDGFSGLLLGASFTKVHFHQVLGLSEGKEQRKLVMTMVVPTPVLAEFCFKTLATIRANKDGIQQGSSDALAAMFTMADRVVIE